MQKVRCASRIVRYPVVSPMVEKKISVETAMTISGTISGRLISAKLAWRPRKTPPRIIASAAAVAMAVAAVEAISAMVSEFHAAWPKRPASGPVKTSPYQRSETPPHWVIEVEPLKL